MQRSASPESQKPPEKPWRRVGGTSDGTKQAELVDIERVTAQLAKRDEARANRDFAVADAILGELTSVGVGLDDRPDQKLWWIGQRANSVSA